MKEMKSFILLCSIVILLGAIVHGQSPPTQQQQTNDVKLPSNCSTSMSIVFPTELLLQSFIDSDTSNFTALWLNFMIASNKQSSLLTLYAISNYSSNEQLVTFLQELNINLTLTQQQLGNLLTSLQVQNLSDAQSLSYGDDCSLRAASTDNLRGPCDFVFIMINRMAATKTMNLLALSEGDVNPQIGEMAYNSLVNSSNNIDKLLQIAKASTCYQ